MLGTRTISDSDGLLTPSLLSLLRWMQAGRSIAAKKAYEVKDAVGSEAWKDSFY